MMELEPRVAILQDLRLQTFDSIRFASYRTASKLRYIQKSTNLHLVDIWNVIEAFRENGLNTLEPQSEVSVARLETLVSSLYHNLNKRLPTAQQVPVDSKAGLLLNWLLAAYTSDNSGKIRVFSIKVALATMCSGKLVDKLRYIFSQISDGAGQLVPWKLGEFLREVLALPAAVYESPTFHYKEGLEEDIFPADNKVTVNDFMAILMSEPGPSCLVWLPLLHRLATVETIVHPTICSVCHKENFTGFRYRCQRCHAYQLCQECFWHGKTSLNHQNDHEVKEYTSYKSPSKQIGHSLRKSFRCVPEKTTQVLPRFPEQPEKTLNLSHIVPPSPLPSHNGFSDPSMLHGGPGGGGPGGGIYDRSSTLDSRATGRSLDSATAASMSRVAAASANDEEHRLIARYAARLAQENRAPAGMSNSENSTINTDNSRAQRELIAQLEAKNKEIMREIARLRRQQEAEQMAPENPALINELRALRQRKGELEGHLGALQDSRRQLMEQLEGLMRMLKNQQTSSPRSTPNSSPRSGKSPPMPTGGVGNVASGGGGGGANSLGSSPMNSMMHAQQQQQQHAMMGGNILRSTQQQLLQAQQSSPLSQQSMNSAAAQSSLHSTREMEASLEQITREVRSAFQSNGSATEKPFTELHNAAEEIKAAMDTLIQEVDAVYSRPRPSATVGEPRFILPLEWHHIDDQESSDELHLYEEIFQTDEDYAAEAAKQIAAYEANPINFDSIDAFDTGYPVQSSLDYDDDVDARTIYLANAIINNQVSNYAFPSIANANDDDVAAAVVRNDVDNNDDDDDNVDNADDDSESITYPPAMPELNDERGAAAFPALHEIGETIDELQLIMHAYILKYSLNC